MADPAVIAVSIPIVCSIGAFTMIIFLRYYQNLERMSMIERGMNPADLKTEFKTLRRRERDPYRFLRIACAVIGVGVGLFVGNLFRAFEVFRYNGGIVAGLVCICGGLGLLIGYFVQMHLQAKSGYKPESHHEDSDIL
jgi:uncharacterized membrane protein YgdD (TMEM256/DUF423 family)